MSERKTEKQSFEGFFRDESLDILGLRKDKSLLSSKDPILQEEDLLPKMPEAQTASETEMRSYWRMLRVFFRTGKGAGIKDEYPALLAPYRHSEYIQTGYPIWASEKPGALNFKILTDLLKETAEEIAPAEKDARILKDNLLRLEHIIQKKLAFADIVYQAKPVFVEAFYELNAELNISGTEGENFTKDLDKLKARLPQEGVLIPFLGNTPYHLLSAFLKTYGTREKINLKGQIKTLIARLNEILAVEKEKGLEAKSEEHLHDTLEFADSFLKFDELSRVLPSEEEDAMPEDRLHRIEKLLATLQEAETQLFSDQASLLVSEDIFQTTDLDWKQEFQGISIESPETGNLCQHALDLFDTKMQQAARIFAAIRISKLELDNNYVPEVHADFFSHFNWRLFSEDELAVCPLVILLTNSEKLKKQELNDFSQLLSSGRPVKILALKQDLRDSKTQNGTTENEAPVFRQEIGALAVAHRNTYVLQTTTADPSYFLEGLNAGFKASTPALFHLFSPSIQQQSNSNLFVKTSAAVEGRDFPAFEYNSEKGPKWGSRFNIRNNPQPHINWPVHQLEIRKANGEKSELDLAFTFADFAAQDDKLKHLFSPVPAAYWSETLVPMSEYMEMEASQNVSHIPFIWMLDSDNTIQKVAVAWPIVLTALERLDFWHYLQENAGIHSFHVEQATELLRKEIETDFAKKSAEMEANYQQDLTQVQEETARNTMEQLAASLLELDFDDLVPIPKTQSTTPRSVEAAPEPNPIEEKKEIIEEAEEEIVLPLGEVYIDTPLCTTCNECINYNKRIFEYNSDKQAFIADPKGGPFLDIVLAAENCPVAIIHPGAPQDPNEPGLEELIKRAEVFN